MEFGETLEAALRRELMEETGVRAGSLRYLGHVERMTNEWHFVIHDYATEVEPDQAGELCAGDDANDARWVPLADVAHWPNLVPGLADFLTEHGVLEG